MNERRGFHKSKLLLALYAGFFSTVANAEFGPGQQEFNVTVKRIFSGTGTTFVTFSSLTGCHINGGYLTVSWPAANGGTVNEERTSQIVSTLLFAKATDTEMEVRYRQNIGVSGWASCTIDAIYLK